MFKQIILPILGVIIFIVVVGYFTQNPNGLPIKSFFSSQPSPTPQRTITIDEKSIQTSVADTDPKRVKGLSGVSSLDAGSGMLFVFDSKQVSPLFWMKDMLIPLDIIWISNGKIVQIDKNIPAPSKGIPDSKLQTYSARVPVDYVLEVNAGFCDQNNIKVGDNVNL